MTRKLWFIGSLFGAMVLALACFQPGQQPVKDTVLRVYKEEVQALAAATKQLADLTKAGAPLPALRKQFVQTRAAYKKVEWLAEYYYPYTAKKINGPALEEVEADEKAIVVQPEGFQVVEELLFTKGPPPDQGELAKQATILASNCVRLQYLIAQQETTDSHIFDALRLEVFRIISLGLTGFDSPVAANSIPEALVAVQSVQHYLSYYSGSASAAARPAHEACSAAIRFLSEAKGFDRFNRMQCIRSFLNPLSRSISELQGALSIPVFTEPRALRAGAVTLFETGIFAADFYAPGLPAHSSSAKIELGRKLFYDGILSGDGQRSCATCHQPAKAFTDGKTVSVAVSRTVLLHRNAPTLINAALQPALFYDMRVSFLEDQAGDVIGNRDEMHGSLQKAVADINRSESYKKMFAQAYGAEAVSELQVKNSIAAYIRSLVTTNARFDQYMRGSTGAMNQQEVDGFNLFAGKAKCATCHFIPLFNGANPPRFDKIDAEVIGVPAGADSSHPVLDADKGKFSLYGIAIQKHAFKTPTLRNIELTAPYMHNGVFNTLEEVIEFYNRGGGAGLGLKIPNQTLPEDRLNLTDPEKRSLIAFMKCLTDTCLTR